MALITTSEIRQIINDGMRVQREQERNRGYRAKIQKQQRLEQELSKRSTCPERVLDYLRDHVGTLDPEQLSRLVREKFYDADVMRAAYCTFESIFKPVDDGGLADNERIRYRVQPIESVGAQSAFGYAIRTNMQTAKDLLILKAPRFPDPAGVIHEYIVGAYGTNLLRKYVPNFAYVFGIFDCTSPILDIGGDVSGWCNSEDNGVYYIAYENINPSITLGDYVATCTFPQFLNLYLQILFSLRIADRTIGFTHYDLHDQNVLVRDISSTHPRGFVIPYETDRGVEYLSADRIATIIDFGQSRIRFEGENFGYFGLEAYGNLPDQSYPLFDAYKLLLMSMRSMLRANNLECFRGASQLLRFFNSRENPRSIIAEQSKFAFVLPRTQATLSVGIDDFLAYIRNNFDLGFLSRTRPRNGILKCNDPECQSPREALGAMGVRRAVGAKDVVEFYDLFDRFVTTGNVQDAEILKRNFNYQGIVRESVDGLVAALGALETSTRQFTIPNVTGVDIRQSKFVSSYRAAFDNFTTLVDNYQSLIIFNRSLQYTANVYSDRQTLSNTRIYSRRLVQIRDALRQIWNQFYSQVVTVSRGPNKWFKETFVQNLQALNTVLA